MTPTDILAKNLRRAATGELKEAEHRFLLLEEWAALCLQKLSAKKKSLSPSALLAELRSTVSAQRAALEEEKPVQSGDLAPLFSQLTLTDYAVFCRALAASLVKDEAHRRVLERKTAAGNTVCYVRTAQAERAFSLFAQNRPDARVFYISNAEEGFSAVDGDRADFCIMPYETADGVRMLQVERLAERYDLHVSALLSVVDSATEERILFALYSKTAQPFVRADAYLAELTLAGGEELLAFSGQLLSVFPYMGCALSRFSCAPDAHGRLRARFSLERGEYGALWLFLSLYCEAAAKLDVFPVLA